MAHITLLGGLASTVFWPFGHVLAQWCGWRVALLIYAAIAALNVMSYAAIEPTPSDRGESRPSAAVASALTGDRRERIVAGTLYALITMLVGFLNSAMAAHMTSILAALDFASASVWIAGLRGIGQSTARLGEVLFGGRLSPLTLNLLAAALLPAGFIVGLGSAQQPAFAIAFALLIGAGIGLMSITRGTVPLVLFDQSAYGLIAGSLLTPSFFVAAAAPVIYAWVIEHSGGIGALYLSAVLALLTLGAAGVLRYFFYPQLAALRRG